MRRPDRAVHKLPSLGPAGRRARLALLDLMIWHQELLVPADQVLSGGSTPGFSPELLAPARASVLQAIGGQQESIPLSSDISPEVVEAFIALSGDPDRFLPSWLREGAP